MFEVIYSMFGKLIFYLFLIGCRSLDLEMMSLGIALSYILPIPVDCTQQWSITRIISARHRPKKHLAAWSLLLFRGCV